MSKYSERVKESNRHVRVGFRGVFRDLRKCTDFWKKDRMIELFMLLKYSNAFLFRSCMISFGYESGFFLENLGRFCFFAILVSFIALCSAVSCLCVFVCRFLRNE
ncbi:hypothetical protein V1511DRAFT_117607 [Dipodascopsis uninucleata]